MRARAVAVLLTLPLGARAQGFEGEIKTRTTSVGPLTLEALELTSPEQVFAFPLERFLALQSDPEMAGAVSVEEAVIAIKGSLIRADVPMPESTDPADRWYLVIDVEKGSTLMVQPGRRRYLAFTEEPAQTPPAAASAPRAPRPRPLGSTRTLGGGPATGYEVRTESQIARGWLVQRDDLTKVARGLQRYAETMARQMGGHLDVDAEDLLLDQGFPMLLQTLEITDDGIGDYEITETVSVVPKAMAASLFAVPAGFQQVTFEQLREENIQ